MPGTNAFRKEPTTWSKPIDILATSALSATGNFINAFNGITLKDIKTSLNSVMNSEASSLKNRSMRRENNHIKTGMKRGSKILMRRHKIINLKVRQLKAQSLKNEW